MKLLPALNLRYILFVKQNSSRYLKVRKSSWGGQIYRRTLPNITGMKIDTASSRTLYNTAKNTIKEHLFIKKLITYFTSNFEKLFNGTTSNYDKSVIHQTLLVIISVICTCLSILLYFVCSISDTIHNVVSDVIFCGVKVFRNQSVCARACHLSL